MYRTVEPEKRPGQFCRGSLKNVFMVTLTNPSEGLEMRFSGEGADACESSLCYGFKVGYQKGLRRGLGPCSDGLVHLNKGV